MAQEIPQLNQRLGNKRARAVVGEGFDLYQNSAGIQLLEPTRRGLITDAYSRKVVGYALYPTLEAVGCMQALQMAIASRKRDMPYILIHHSDRGIQYCCADYVTLLEAEQIAISMTQNGSPYDNAQAERVNGTIKNEFFPTKIYRDHQEAAKEIAKIIAIYNQKVPFTEKAVGIWISLTSYPHSHRIVVIELFFEWL